MRMAKKKMHGWLIAALADAGYQQRDLAKAWHVDDAVVSRFISSGKPDLTPERQMTLSQMLGMTNDQLLGRLYGGVSVPGVIQLRPAPVPVPAPLPVLHGPPRSNGDSAFEATRCIERCTQQLEALLPGARVTVNIEFDSKRRDK